MSDPMLLIQMLVLLLITGAISGVLAGLLGVGGGIVLVPAFFYVFGALGFEGPQLMQLCLATSLATIIVTSVRSVTSHNKKGAVDWDILRTWAPGIVIGAARRGAGRVGRGQLAVWCFADDLWNIGIDRRALHGAGQIVLARVWRNANWG